MNYFWNIWPIFIFRVLPLIIGYNKTNEIISKSSRKTLAKNKHRQFWFVLLIYLWFTSQMLLFFPSLQYQFVFILLSSHCSCFSLFHENRSNLEKAIFRFSWDIFSQNWYYKYWRGKEGGGGGAESATNTFLPNKTKANRKKILFITFSIFTSIFFRCLF